MPPPLSDIEEEGLQIALLAVPMLAKWASKKLTDGQEADVASLLELERNQENAVIAEETARFHGDEKPTGK